MNLVVITGELADDAKEFATKTGKFFSKLTVKNVSVNGKYSSTVYVPVLCFGKSAEGVRGAQAGAKCEVKGSLISKKNETTGKYEISVQADKVEVLGFATNNQIPQMSDEDIPF